MIAGHLLGIEVTVIIDNRLVFGKFMDLVLSVRGADHNFPRFKSLYLGPIE